MDDSLLVPIYRVSGWSIILSVFFLVIFAAKSKNVWKGRYKYLALNFCAIFLLELIAAITALLLTNNMFVDYFYVTIEFSLLMLYLKGQYKAKVVHLAVILIVFAFIALQIYKALDMKMYKFFDAQSLYINIGILFIFSLVNLTVLIRNDMPNTKLRNSPDFWFTATLFCACFLDFFVSILGESVYASGSALVFYLIYIFRNFVYASLFYGYYRGMKQLG